jgi:O-antigen ligase
MRTRIWLWLFLASIFICTNVGLINPFIPMYLPYDIRRCVEGIFLGIVVLALILDSSLRTNWLKAFFHLPRTAQAAWAVFFIMGIVSAYFATIPNYSAMLVAWYFLMLAAGISWAVLRQKLGRQFDVSVLTALCLTIACYCVYAMYNYIFQVMTFYQQHNNLYLQTLSAPGFLNARFFMQFLSISLPFVALPFLMYRKQLGYTLWLWALFAAYLWCLAFANESRVLYLEIVIVPICLWTLFGKKALPWLKVQGILLIIGFILYLILFKAIILIATRFDAAHLFVQFTTDNGRFMLWKTAFILWSSNPLIGIGPLHYAFYAKSYEALAAHPHNIWIMLGCEWGTIALIAILILNIWGIVRWCKAARVWSDEPSFPYMLALTAALISAMLDGAVSGSLVMPLSQMMLMLSLGWLFGMYLSYVSVPNNIPPRINHLVLIACLLVAVMFALSGILPMLSQLKAENVIVMMNCTQKFCLLNPNFWAEGWIQYYPH